MMIFAKFMLIFWVPLTIYWFQKKDARVAVLLSYIGGICFLPKLSIDLPVITYNKEVAIALGILIGEALSKKRVKYKKNNFDRILILYCFISPIISSVINGFGAYEGFVNGLALFFSWGVSFVTGRKYFRKEEDLKLLIRYILAGVLIYVPLCQYELRMSPQLNLKIYGFFQHSWIQHFRYGGYRPIVFMTHGLMVSFWLMAGAVVSFWMWRDKNIRKMFHLPLLIVFAVCFTTLVMSKSKGALFLGILGLFSWFIYKRKTTEKFFVLLIIIVPVYFLLRIQSLVTVNDLSILMSRFFDEERIESLLFRLNSEEVLLKSMGLGQVFWGWSRWARGINGVNPLTNRAVVVDSLWIISYASQGLLGLLSQFTLILAGPLTIIRNMKKNHFCLESIVLCLIIILFAYDCLVNAMMNVIYTLCSGALVSYCEYLVNNKRNLLAV